MIVTCCRSARPIRRGAVICSTTPARRSPGIACSPRPTAAYGRADGAARRNVSLRQSRGCEDVSFPACEARPGLQEPLQLSGFRVGGNDSGLTVDLLEGANMQLRALAPKT